MLDNKIRIIAGQWRRRNLSFASSTGLRPTPDRVREAVFSWLMPHLSGSHCLDMFAGSGALGFEAASRGASQVVMTDSHLSICRQLAENSELLDADNIIVQCLEAPMHLSLPSHPYDIVFIDPPYQSNLWRESCQRLVPAGWLSPNALIYVENDKPITQDDIPKTWKLVKAKRAGQVCYHLLQAG